MRTKVSEEMGACHADAVTLKPGSHFKGNILAKTNIAMQSGATLNGRALAQTAVTLIANTVTLP